jgi:hypothetical protein
MLECYLEKKLEELNGNNVINNSLLNSNLNWTATKVDLVELIYALQLSGAINGGNYTATHSQCNFLKNLR